MPPKKKTKTINVFIVSDATGATAESVLTATQVHFKGSHFDVKRFPFTKTEVQVKAILDQVTPGRCIIIFTLASPKLRKLLTDAEENLDITLVDVMGPLVDIFSNVVKHRPRLKPGAGHPHRDEEMYRVTEAIHYTLLHDDGQNLDTLHEADLIILGVSRTGKTPTSIYLSCRKLKVANIPILPDVPLDPKIAKLPVKKVGFLISMERLQQLRAERAFRMQLPEYASLSSILHELEWCDAIYSKIPRLRTADVTNRSIEETSEWITHHVM